MSRIPSSLGCTLPLPLGRFLLKKQRDTIPFQPTDESDPTKSLKGLQLGWSQDPAAYIFTISLITNEHLILLKGSWGSYAVNRCFTCSSGSYMAPWPLKATITKLSLKHSMQPRFVEHSCRAFGVCAYLLIPFSKNWTPLHPSGGRFGGILAIILLRPDLLPTLGINFCTKGCPQPQLVSQALSSGTWTFGNVD